MKVPTYWPIRTIPSSLEHLLWATQDGMDESMDGRALTTRELEILELLLSADIPGVEQLRVQVEFARADPWECGCGSINLVVEKTAAPRSPITASADVEPVIEAMSKERQSQQGVFDLILFVEDGWLSGIELVDYSFERHRTDGPHVFPPPVDFNPPTAWASSS